MQNDCKTHGSCPSQAMSVKEIEEARPRLEETWQYQLEQTPNYIFKEFNFNSYIQGIEFANKIANLAEDLNHHPQITIGYKTVRLEYYTHNANGLTEMDIAAVEAIDELNI